MTQTLNTLMELHGKTTPETWSSSPQKGEPGHCMVAQVWDNEGVSLACVEPTDDPEVSSANAAFIVAAHTSLPEIAEYVRRLEEALWGLEKANDAMARKRSVGLYVLTEADCREEMIALDAARASARSALSDRAGGQ